MNPADTESGIASAPLALVTGVSSGIGAAVARSLLHDGWAVLGASRRRPDITHERLLWQEADLARPDAAIDDIAAALPASPTAIVHSAGVQRSAYLGELDAEAGAEMWRLNVDVPTRLVNRLSPQMRDGGSIVLMGSRTSTGVAGKSQYSASKAALDGLTRSWAMELADRRITVNVVAPGPTETPMLNDPARSATPPVVPKLGRLIDPGEVGDLVAFLVGPTGRSITGQRFAICGGASL